VALLAILYITIAKLEIKLEGSLREHNDGVTGVTSVEDGELQKHWHFPKQDPAVGTTTTKMCSHLLYHPIAYVTTPNLVDVLPPAQFRMYIRFGQTQTL
jgi:hypothetical protein